MTSNTNDGFTKIVIFLVIPGFLIGFLMWGIPHYSVWQQGLAGEAELKRAEQNRKIAVNEAEAKRDAAKMLAEAEVERAKGVTEANRIIGEGLKGHDEYLRYLWITSLEKVAESVNGSTVIYVPTEANLPIMEAGRAVGGVDLEVKEK